MRRSLWALLLAALTASASAQTAKKDDDHELPLSIFATPAPPPIKFDFHLLSLHLEIPMPSLREPLPGSVPANTSVLPTAFALNHVSFPYRPGYKSIAREKAEALIGKQE